MESSSTREDSRDSTGIANVHVDAVWEARNMENGSPEKSMNVSNVKVSDEEWFLFRDVTIKANTKLVKERCWITRVASQIVFQSFIQTLAIRCKMSSEMSPMEMRAKQNARTSVGGRGVRKQRALEVRRPRACCVFFF